MPWMIKPSCSVDNRKRTANGDIAKAKLITVLKDLGY